MNPVIKAESSARELKQLTLSLEKHLAHCHAVPGAYRDQFASRMFSAINREMRSAFSAAPKSRDMDEIDRPLPSPALLAVREELIDAYAVAILQTESDQRPAQKQVPMWNGERISV